MHQGNSLTESAKLVIKKPLGKWCVLPEPFLPTSSHVFSPDWATGLCIYEPVSGSASSACFLAEILSGYILAINVGLDYSLAPPLSECLPLDGGGDQMRGLTRTLGWRGNAPLKNIPKGPLWLGDISYTWCPLLTR